MVRSIGKGREESVKVDFYAPALCLHEPIRRSTASVPDDVPHRPSPRHGRAGALQGRAVPLPRRRDLAAVLLLARRGGRPVPAVPTRCPLSAPPVRPPGRWRQLRGSRRPPPPPRRSSGS